MNSKTSALPKPRTAPSPYVILGFSLFLLYGFGYETLYQRLIARAEGVIVSSRDVHSANNPRYITEYLLRPPDGHETKYVAGSSDASLPQSMPLGTTISKRKWHLDYERDGEQVSDFPTALYGLTLGAGLAGLVWSILLFRQR
jgi:hypothetical protein